MYEDVLVCALLVLFSSTVLSQARIGVSSGSTLGLACAVPAVGGLSEAPAGAEMMLTHGIKRGWLPCNCLQLTIDDLSLQLQVQGRR